MVEWLDSDQIQQTEANAIKEAIAFNQATRAAEAEMLDVDFLLSVMEDHETLHVEEQSEDV